MTTEEKNAKQKEDFRKVYDYSQHLKELLKEITSEHLSDGFKKKKKTSIFFQKIIFVIYLIINK